MLTSAMLYDSNIKCHHTKNYIYYCMTERAIRGNILVEINCIGPTEGRDGLHFLQAAIKSYGSLINSGNEQNIELMHINVN